MCVQKAVGNKCKPISQGSFFYPNTMCVFIYRAATLLIKSGFVHERCNVENAMFICMYKDEKEIKK